MSDLQPPPYPAGTKAKGWRFELDYEAIQQSDTWALANEVPMAQPALLMMWLTAWAQIPCGSFPDDDDVIRAKCKIPAKDWARMRPVLMRGWWKAADGRLYHPVIAQRVAEMLARKEGERTRKAEFRSRKEAELKLAEANALAQKDTDCPEMSHGTDTGHARDGRGKDATGTGTGTGLESSTPPPRAGAGACEPGPAVSQGTDAGRVCRLMRDTGLADANPGHPELLLLLQAGATDEEFTSAAGEAVRNQAGFAYALAVAVKRRQRARAKGATLHAGPLPAPAQPPPTETAHARKMREAAQGLAPGVARRTEPAAAAHAATPVTFDMEAPNALAIARH